MSNPGNKYKFYLRSYVYFNKIGNKFLLYNTKNGDCFESNSLECCNLVEEVYAPENLGVIYIYEEQLKNKEILHFINIVMEKGLGKLVKINTNEPPIVNLLPILNLQSDIDRLKKNNETLTDNVQIYLNELNIYINENCNLNCLNCKRYYKQVKSCYKGNNNKFLPLIDIKKILDEASNSLLKKVNLLGGNLYLYPYLKELIALLNEYKFEFHFWIHYNNSKEDSLLNSNIKTEILVTFPINDVNIFFEFLEKHTQNRFHFIVENELQVDQISQILKNHFNNYTILPFYNGCNIDFFKKEIFLEKQDILNTINSQREIFRNQKMNLHYFGKLYIFPDGNIKANLNSSILGNISYNSLLEIIYGELHENTAWRKIREEKPCNECLYQFLCPPPSNYEQAIGVPNLCHIFKKSK